MSVRAQSVQAEPSPSGHIVLVAPEDQKPDFWAILQNTRSQMVDIPIVVTVHWIDALPAAPEDQERLMARIRAETGAALVFWCDLTQGESVTFLFQGTDGPHLLERPLQGSGEEGVADAISLITRTTVELLLARGTLTPAPDPPATEPTPLPESPAPTPAPPLPLRLSLNLAYAFGLTALTPAFSHGGRFSLTLDVGPVLQVAFGADFSTPYESRESGAAMEQMRFPLSLGVAALAAIDRWRVGGGLNGVFSIARNTPKSIVDNLEVDPPFTRFVFSLELLIRGEYAVLKNLSLFLAVGVEVFPEKTTYIIENGPVLFDEVLSLHPKLLAGLSLYLM